MYGIEMDPNGNRPMTVENLTILFTDLVGSTEHQTRLAPSGADELRHEHFTVLRQSIAEAGGTEVKNLGDGLMVVFPTASSAIRCAVGMQQAVELDGRERDHPLGIRVGISSGEVTAEDGDYFGDPVIEASRLCALCQSGQILAADIVRLNAGRRNPHAARPLGQRALKGLPDPIDVVEVLWEVLDARDPAERTLPTLLTDRGRFPFAGRQKELDLLTSTFGAVSSGATRLVLVAGEPGIGKTRLTSEMGSRALDAGAIVLAGRSDEFVGIPYQPYVESLRWRISQPGGVDQLGDRAAELVRLAPELLSILPDLGAPTESSAEAERIALFEGVRGWLASLAAEHPVVLVLDDLHWSDMGSLLLLRHIIATNPVARLLVVATYRDTDLDRTHPLSSVLAEFHRRGDVERIALDGLDTMEVTDLVTLTAGHELDDAGINLVHGLVDDTGGNPFFVSEVLRHLAESGVLTLRDGRWVAVEEGATYLPEGIRQVVGRRLTALSAETQRILTCAAVIGPRFGLDLLALVCDLAIDDVLDALDPAIAAHLVLDIGVGEYQFAHALVRSTLHAEITTTRRARLHLSVAQTLEKLHPDDLDVVTNELAYHWGEVGVMDASDPAFSYARRAAELATERVAPYEAVKWYRIAIERLDGADPRIHAELLCDLGIAESITGEPEWGATLIAAAQRAETLGESALMIRALSVDRRTAQTSHAQEPDLPRISLLERALERGPYDLGTTCRLKFLLAAELLYTGDFSRRQQLYEEASDGSNALSDPKEWFFATRESGTAAPFTALTRENCELGRARTRDAIAAFRESSELEPLIYAYWALTFYEVTLGSSTLDTSVDEFEALALAWPHPLLRSQIQQSRFFVELKSGRSAGAAQAFSEFEHWARICGSTDTQIYGGLVALQVSREADGIAWATAAFEQSPILERERHDGVPGVVTALMAQCLAEAGELDEAAQLVDQAFRHGFKNQFDDASLPIGRAAWSETAAKLRDKNACEALIDLFLPYHDTHLATGFFYAGSMARYLAILFAAVGDHVSADGWFTQAIANHASFRTPPWLARTRIDWAEDLHRRGEVERAGEQARQALVDIGSLELTLTRNRASALLSSLG